MEYSFDELWEAMLELGVATEGGLMINYKY